MSGGNKRVVRQHLIDPVSCIRCDSCKHACPNKAISMVRGTLAIDFALCDGVGDCVDQCQTGAINSWRLVPADGIYPVSEQIEWEELPEQAEVEMAERDAPPILPAVGHGPPRSAATPQINRYPVGSPAAARVIANVRLTPDDASSDIRHLIFDVGGTEFRVLEGQSVGVLAAGTDESGKPHAMRLYSVASARDGEAGEARHIAFTVKRIIEDHDGKPHRGICSNYLCDLPPGDSVQLVGPFGTSFLMPDDPAARILMICTGTGIAPMRGIIERRLRAGNASPRSLLLFYGGRTPEELPYHDQLVGRHGDMLDLNLALSRVPGLPRHYVQDALAARAADVAALLADPDGYVYLCGLSGMEEGVLAAFGRICSEAGLDWPALHDGMKQAGRIHIETY